MTAEADQIKRAVTALRSGCSPSQVVASIAAFYAYPLPDPIPNDHALLVAYQAGRSAATRDVAKAIKRGNGPKRWWGR